MPEKTLRLVCEIKAARVEAAPKYPGVYADPALLAELQKIGARRFGPDFSEHQRQ